MEERNEIKPPPWAARLLSWYCKPELLEDLQGDLSEYFERNIKSRGIRKARFIYVMDVFKFFRLYTIRKPEFVNPLINWIMIGSYVKTSGRNIVRNKLFSTINIAGLAISISVGLMMIGVLSDIFSYDKFNENHERIYRVTTKYNHLDHEPYILATTSPKVAKAITQDFSIPEAVAIFQNGFDGDIKAEEKAAVPLHGYWANESLFKVFSFHLLKGNPATALKAPYSIVLTETPAHKLFGSQEALNKVVTLGKAQYTVTGILKDLPKFSHVQFEMLGSLTTNDILAKDDKDYLSWDNVWGTWVYLLLPSNADLKNLKTNFDQLSAKEDPTVKNTHVDLSLLAMDDIMLGEDLSNPIGTTMGGSMIWIFGGLAFVVILSACFNYTNLSIARSLRRTREVGIRKVIGALKSHVVGQFIVETVLISLGSLLVSLLIFLLLRPYFIGVEEGLQKMLTLELSPAVIGYFVLFAIGVGIAAGLFPALFFSKINPTQALKDFSSGIGFKKLTMRKVLIVLQYSISIILITSTVIIYKQYKHFVAFDLGFNTENILNISLQGNKAEILRKELSELQEVKGISQSVMVTSVGNYWGTFMKNPATPEDSAYVVYNTVDENYLPLHEHKLVAGRNFNAKLDSANETEIIVNEDVIKRLHIAEQNPEKAIGEIVKVDGKDVQIVGVMRDFHYGRANDRNTNCREVILRYSQRKANLLNVKIQSSDILATHEKIEAIWKKIDQVHPLDAKFYSEQIEKSFAGLKASVKVAGFIAFLAISIASLGLLGMVVFTTETRLKEISIRKVLGASEAGLLYLLSQVLFQELANHAPIAIADLFAGAAVIMVLALVMISLQTFKATRTNPAEVLKTE